MHAQPYIALEIPLCSHCMIMLPGFEFKGSNLVISTLCETNCGHDVVW
jgi:hypothetical protein